MRIDKALSAAGCLFLVTALGIICVTPPAKGYELILYDAYPLYLWVFFVGAISCGIGILVRQALTREKSKWWIAGLLLVTSVNCIFLLLPTFRGYAIWGHGDILTHVGYMKDILYSGYIGEGNYYPMLHVLWVSLIEVTNLSPGVAINILAACFSIVYISNMYLLAKAISKSHKGAILLVAFASPLVFLWAYAKPWPSHLSFVMLPLVLYFFHRLVFSPANRPKNAVLMILLAIFVVFAHPSIAVFMVAMILIFGAAVVIYPILVGREDGLTARRRRIAAVVSLSFGVGSMTLLSLSSFTGAYAISAIKRFVANSDSAMSTGLFSSGDQVLLDNSLIQLEIQKISASYIVNQYGAALLFLTIAGIAALVVIVRAIMRARGSSPLHFAYGIIFIVIAVVTAFQLFVHTPEGNIVRVLRIPLFAGTVIGGLVTYELVTRFARKSDERGFSLRRLSCVAAITLFLVAVATLSGGAVYTSPRVWSYNQQVPHTSLTGTRWFIENRDPSVPIAVFNTNYLSRLCDYHLGVEYRRSDRSFLIIKPLPTHFGYDEHDSIAEVFDYGDTYIAVLPVDLALSVSDLVNVRRQVFRCTADDIANLENDFTTSHIYSGGQFGVCLTHTSGSDA